MQNAIDFCSLPKKLTVTNDSKHVSPNFKYCLRSLTIMLFLLSFIINFAILYFGYEIASVIIAYIFYEKVIET